MTETLCKAIMNWSDLASKYHKTKNTITVSRNKYIFALSYMRKREGNFVTILMLRTSKIRNSKDTKTIIN